EKGSGEKIRAVPGPDTQFTSEMRTSNDGSSLLWMRLRGRLDELVIEFPGLGMLEGNDAVVDLKIQTPIKVPLPDDAAIQAWGTFTGRLTAVEISDQVRAAGIESLAIDAKLTIGEKGSVDFDIRDLIFEIPEAVIVESLRKGMPPSLPVPDHK